MKPVAEMLATLAAVPLDEVPDAIGVLEAAKARLVALGVDPGRLFLAQGGERARKEAGARVYFTLK